MSELSYRAYGLILASDTPLPELSPAGAGEVAEVQVRLAARDALPSRAAWFMVWSSSEGEPWLLTARHAAGYLLRFPRLAEFAVSRDGREIVGRPWPDATPSTLRHLLLDQVLPLTLTLQGRTALHATAVLTPYGVCAFTGPAGAGKSTLAASFVLAGCPLVSDDCLVLADSGHGIVAVPGYPALRLWDDVLAGLGDASVRWPSVTHSTAKRRVAVGWPAGEFASEPRPLARVYGLAGTGSADGNGHGKARVESVSPRDGLVQLVCSAFRLEVADRAAALREFRFFERVAMRVPVRRLHTPDDLAALSAVREAVLADLGDP